MVTLTVCRFLQALHLAEHSNLRQIPRHQKNGNLYFGMSLLFLVLAKWIGIWRDYDYDDYHNDDDDDDNDQMKVQGNLKPGNNYTISEELHEPQTNYDDNNHSNVKGQG